MFVQDGGKTAVVAMLFIPFRPLAARTAGVKPTPLNLPQQGDRFVEFTFKRFSTFSRLFPSTGQLVDSLLNAFGLFVSIVLLLRFYFFIL